MSEKARKAAAATAAGEDDYYSGMMDAAPKDNKNGTYLRLPAGVTLFKGKEDVPYQLIFFPWKAGKNNPAGAPGMTVINRFLTVHQNVGSDNEWHLCPQKFGQHCCICQAKADVYAQTKGKRLSKDDYKKMIQPLNAKDREMFLIHEVGGKTDNLQVWEESVHLFGNFLRKWIAAKPQYRKFASIKDGLIVEVTGTVKQIGEGGSCTQWDMISFEPRTEPLSEKLIAKIAKACPDDWVFSTSGEKLKKAFLMLGHDDETPEDETLEPAPEEEEIEEPEETPAPAPKKKPKPAPAPEPEEEEEEEAEEETPAPAPKKKPKPTPEPEPEEEEEVEEEEAAAPPAPKKKPKPAPAPEPEEEEEESEEASEEEEVEEEEEEEVEEDEPTPAPKKKPAGGSAATPAPRPAGKK